MKIAPPHAGRPTRLSPTPSHPEDGQTTVVMAMFMATFLFGFVALGVDTEALFHAKRQAQAAADAAATAYAEEYGYGAATQLTAAKAAAKLNGFDTAVDTTITVNSPPLHGNYTTSSANAFYEVLVSAPIPTFFARVVTHTPTITVTGRAVSGAGLTSPTCVCLEGTSGTDLNLSNNSKLTPSSCGTTVDSSSSTAVEIAGSANLGGLSLGTVASGWSTAQNGSNVNNGGSISSGTKVVEGIATSCAPPLPAVPSYTAAKCTADPDSNYQGGQQYNIGPGGAAPTITQTGSIVCYNSLTIGDNNKSVNLNPGIYVINGGSLHFESGANNASNTGGSGVFFYLVGNASLTIDNGANVNLTAPTSGTYAGTLVFQDPADTQALSIQGGSNTSFNGAIYAPDSNVTLGNGSSTALSADLVAKTLTMNGGGTLSSTASSNFGSLNISTAKVAE
jgi:Flp pilus assembly protein TadG